MFVGVRDTVWGPTMRFKRDADVQHRGWAWFSTCHDGLLTPLRGAITRGPGPLTGRLEIRHHTRGVAAPAGCFSRTLSASLQLCRKYSAAALRGALGRVGQRSRFQHAGVPPRAAPPQDASIFASLLA